MNIILAEHFGICFGVRDAIAQAEQLASGRSLTILGELVHNPLVRDRLKARGIVEDKDGTVPRNGLAMITAHGASDKRRKQLQKAGLTIADATCPLVRQAHAQLKQLVCAGYFPVVIGLRDHVEVRGLTEDFASSFVVSCEGDLGNLPTHLRYGVISQTTQPIDRVRELVAQIRRAHPNSEVRFVDTVCKPTKDRQHALQKLIAVADTIVVIGGRHSNNTRQLVETAISSGRRTIHIERPEELNLADFACIQTVGVTAGTSTLPDTMQAVVQRLKEISSELNTKHQTT